jgi:hypothetical protein
MLIPLPKTIAALAGKAAPRTVMRLRRRDLAGMLGALLVPKRAIYIV